MTPSRTYIVSLKGDSRPAHIQADRMEVIQNDSGNDIEYNFYLGDRLVGHYFVADTRGWHSVDLNIQDTTYI